MDIQSPILLVKLEDLHLEAVLDKGFVGDYSFVDDTHVHSYYELILATRDSVLVEPTQSLPLVLQTGQACLLPPGLYHRVRAVTDASQKLAIRFHYTQEGQGSLYFPLHSALQHCRQPVLMDQPQLHASLLALQRQFSSPLVTRTAFLHCLLQQVFLLLMEQLLEDIGSEPVSDANSARRLQFEEYLSDHFCQSITEADLAVAMHLSKRQVSRILKQIYGKSFRRLLAEMRLQEACRLLGQTDLSIEEIAIRVGYCSVSGFYTAFQKEMGMTAGNYRKSVMDDV